jgi:hypothetical protein
MSYNSLEDIDRILSSRYPAREELREFPLGEKLAKLDTMIWTNEMRCIGLNLQESKEKEIFDVIVEYTQPDTKLEAREELKKVITGKLKDAGRISKNEKITDVFRDHIEQCMKGIRLLTNDSMEKFFKDPQSGYEPYVNFQSRMIGFKPFEKKVLRLATLYHDIGKVIHRDKHPMLGQHLLESLKDDDRKQFLEIFSSVDKEFTSSEKCFYSMLDLVGHHDLFGTLCTGEASRTAFIEASGLRLREITDAKRIIDFIVILNMADIYGSIGPLPKERAEMILNDWYTFEIFVESTNPIVELFSGKADKKKQNLLKDLLVSKKDLENKLTESEQEPEKTIERIRRIVVSGILYGKDKILGDDGKEIPFFKDSRIKLADKITPDMIRSILVKELGPELQSFCRDFALICKLDYTLRFITAFCDKWIMKNFTSISKDGDYRLETLVIIILDVLIRLVRCYRDLTLQKDGGQRRIGLELLDLTRSKEIMDQVITLLLDKDRKSEGINWIADETTAWYYA